MFITDGQISLTVFTIRCGVIIYFSYFFYSILYRVSVCILWKLLPGMSPFIPFVKSYFISYFFIISIQLYLDALRTLSILVVCIFPFLGYLYTCFFRLIAVCDIVAFNFRFITCHRVFFYCVLNFFTFIIVFRQILEDIFPLAIFIRFYIRILNRIPVSKKNYCYFIRAFFILVICIIPGLFTADIYFRILFVFNSLQHCFIRTKISRCNMNIRVKRDISLRCFFLPYCIIIL